MSLVLSILSRWLIQFCLYLTSCIPEASGSFLITLLFFGSSLVYPLTLRLLMSYIYIYMQHLFLMFLDHTQRRSTVGRTPLDELITRPEESYRLCRVVVFDLETSRMGAPYIYIYIYIYI